MGVGAAESATEVADLGRLGFGLKPMMGLFSLRFFLFGGIGVLCVVISRLSLGEKTSKVSWFQSKQNCKRDFGFHLRKMREGFCLAGGTAFSECSGALRAQANGSREPKDTRRGFGVETIWTICAWSSFWRSSKAARTRKRSGYLAPQIVNLLLDKLVDSMLCQVNSTRVDPQSLSHFHHRPPLEHVKIE